MPAPPHESHQPILVDDAIQKFLVDSPFSADTQAVYRSTLRRFAEYLGPGRRADDIEARDVATFLQTFNAFAPNTYNTNLTALRSFSHWCIQNGIATDDFASPFERRRRPRPQ